MLENRNKFKMGYSIFQNLTEDIKNNSVLPDLPPVVENNLVKKTKILDIVISRNTEMIEETR